MLTNTTRKRIDLPHEPGEWIECAPLTFDEDERARDVQTQHAIRKFAGMDTAVWDSLPRRGESEATAPAAPKERDPLADYHVPTVLELAVRAWSYDAPVTPENIAALDAETARYVAAQLVYRLEPEESRKNGLRRSTAT